MCVCVCTGISFPMELRDDCVSPSHSDLPGLRTLTLWVSHLSSLNLSCWILFQAASFIISELFIAFRSLVPFWDHVSFSVARLSCPIMKFHSSFSHCILLLPILVLDSFLKD